MPSLFPYVCNILSINLDWDTATNLPIRGRGGSSGASGSSEITTLGWVRPRLGIVWYRGSPASSGLMSVEKNYYSDVIMGAVASQITSLTIVYSTVYSGADQRKQQSSAKLAFVNSPHKWPVTRKMVPFDDVIMTFDLRSQTLLERRRSIAGR